MTITWLRDRAVGHAITTISKLKQFIPHGGIVRPAITYDESGGNLRSEIDGTPSNGSGSTPRVVRSSRLRRYGARLTRDRRSYHRDEDETTRQSRPKIQM